MDERRLIVRAVIAFYASGIGVFTGDLVSCEMQRPGKCDSSRERLMGALSAGPAALLGILVKSSPSP